MAETLLSLSEVLLFGRCVEDLQIRSPNLAAATPADLTTTRRVPGGLRGRPTIDGVAVAAGDIVLVRHHSPAINGLYTVAGPVANWAAAPAAPVIQDGLVNVQRGNRFGNSFWVQTSPNAAARQTFRNAGGRRGLGRNSQLDNELDNDSCFARIYGFSYEGTYYELPNPTLFLVHGEGESATDDNSPGILASRAPNDPSQSGVAAADFQIADDIRVWAYDKADYTIRMDVETGMFEQVRDRMKTVEAGAATQIWAATAPELASHSGAYLANCQLGVVGAETKKVGVKEYAYDADNARRLWELSEQLVGESRPDDG